MTCKCRRADDSNNDWPVGEVITAMADAAEPFTRPLTLVVNTRNGQHFVIDGVKDDTRVSLSSLDDVDKAAIKVLLQQALREIDPPKPSITGITINSSPATAIRVP